MNSEAPELRVGVGMKVVDGMDAGQSQVGLSYVGR